MHSPRSPLSLSLSFLLQPLVAELLGTMGLAPCARAASILPPCDFLRLPFSPVLPPSRGVDRLQRRAGSLRGSGTRCVYRLRGSRFVSIFLSLSLSSLLSAIMAGQMPDFVLRTLKLGPLGIRNWIRSNRRRKRKRTQDTAVVRRNAKSARHPVLRYTPSRCMCTCVNCAIEIASDNKNEPMWR